jgi:hypothetical protein
VTGELLLPLLLLLLLLLLLWRLGVAVPLAHLREAPWHCIWC